MTRKRKPTASLVRSSAAEYLTFVAASGTGGVEAVYADENVWLSQKMMAQLYDVDVRTINYHLKTIFTDSELEAGGGRSDSNFSNHRRRRQDLRHQALQPFGHHRRRVQGQLRARGAVPRVGHACRRGVHHQGLRDGRRAPEARRLRPERSLLRGAAPARPRDPASERKFYQKITDIYRPPSTTT
jgi:hypothetical protein